MYVSNDEYEAYHELQEVINNSSIFKNDRDAYWEYRDNMAAWQIRSEYACSHCLLVGGH